MSKFRVARPIDQLTFMNICGWPERNSTIDHRETISWFPRKEETLRISEVAKAVHTGTDLPTILDIGCGTGLLDYLLAETRDLRVVGLDPDAALVLHDLYKHPNLTLEVGDSKAATQRYGATCIDVVINSWMPNGVDLSADIESINPKVIVYMLDNWGHTGIFGTSYKHKRYPVVLGWEGFSSMEIGFIGFYLKHGYLFDVDYPGYLHGEKRNVIKIMFRYDQEPVKPDINLGCHPKYYWEDLSKLERCLKHLPPPWLFDVETIREMGG